MKIKGPEIQQAAQELQQKESESEVARAGVEKLIANLETKQAQFEAKIAQNLANVTQKEAQLAQKETRLDVREAIEDGEESMRQNASQAMEQFNAQLVEDVGLMMRSIHHVATQLEGQAGIIDQISKKKPPAKIRAVRENGQLVAIPEYDAD